jgi:hypothetical protein
MPPGQRAAGGSLGFQTPMTSQSRGRSHHCASSGAAKRSGQLKLIEFQPIVRAYARASWASPNQLSALPPKTPESRMESIWFKFIQYFSRLPKFIDFW